MSNHQNRSKRGPARNPKPAQIIAARERLQEDHRLGVATAQKHCADLVYTSVGMWQAWESGDLRMHRASWELFLIKTQQGHMLGGEACAEG